MVQYTRDRCWCDAPVHFVAFAAQSWRSFNRGFGHDMKLALLPARHTRCTLQVVDAALLCEFEHE
jgi:hypothetical protein